MAGLAKLRRPGHGEKLGFGWRLTWFVLYPPASLLFRLRYLHLERIPQDGPAILVVNHVSHVDPFLVSKLVLDGARVPRFLAKESIFEIPVVGWGMRAMGHIPVRRGTPDARQSLAAAVAALGRGELIVLHPEGTVTRDPEGWPMAGKTGAARLATLVPDVPVIPVAQWGVQEQVDLYAKKIKLVPRPRHTLSVGEPIDLSAFHGVEATPRVLREITEVVMTRLRHDVADLRRVPEPAGSLFVGGRLDETPSSDAA